MDGSEFDGAPTDATGGTDADPAAWRAQVDPAYARVAEKFSSPAEVVKSYAELERKLGGMVTPPGDGAEAEERESFYKRLGRPETPDGYEIQPPEWLPEGLVPDAAGDERQHRFLEEAHRMGLSQEQAQAAVNWYYGELKQELEDADPARLEAALRKEWGSDYERNVQYGRRALEAFGDADTADRLERIVGDAGVMRMFARIGRRMGEGSDMTGNMGGGARDSLQDELKELLKAPDYWTNDKIQRRVREINVRLHGTGPVAGAAPDQNL